MKRGTTGGKLTQWIFKQI